MNKKKYSSFINILFTEEENIKFQIRNDPSKDKLDVNM